MKIEREELLQQLELVIPGVSKRDMIEQSNCFLFLKDRIVTYNDEMMISAKCETGITGAVQAEPLLALIRKLSDAELEITSSDSHIKIKGKGRRLSAIRLDKQVIFDYSKMEFPGEEDWKTLPDEFVSAVSRVYQCAGKDSSQFSLTCVHLHKKWIEAFDNFQITRYFCKMDLKESILVPASTIKNVVSMDINKFGLTDSWIHFTNEDELLISCRTDKRDYPDTSPILEEEGSEIVIPKGLSECVERAEIFSVANQDENVVEVTLGNETLQIKGEGAVGWYKEQITIPYKGEEIHFLVPPSLLYDLSSIKSTQCEVSEDKLIVRGEKWIYVTALGKSRKE